MLSFLRSLQWRLVFIFVSVPFVLMVFVWVFLSSAVESTYYQSFINNVKFRLERNLNIGENPTKEEIKSKFSDRTTIYIFSVDSSYRNYTIIENSTYEIMYSTDTRVDLEDKQGKEILRNEIFSSPNFTSASAGNEGNKAKLMQNGNRVYFDYAVKKGNFVFYFTYDREDWKSTIQAFNNIIVLSSFLAALASLIIGYILSRAITVPVVNLMHKAQKIASGDFDQVLEVKSGDEIGRLTMAFNYMARALKKNVAEISSEKNKIETILNYMTDGVIAFNMAGRVIHANPAAKKMLELKDTEFSFNDFSQKHSLRITLEEIIYIQPENISEKSFDFNDKYIRAYFALFTDEGKKVEGVITVLQDITEQQRLENMRREFVANVSHELRTPLTSIKSYTETLLDGVLDDRDTAERFLGVINSESDRMTRLVKDLLQLSRLDNQQMQWNYQKISFVELVRHCVEKLQMEAKNKGQLIHNYVIGEIPEITADRDRIEQVVINILSNAIKYTPAAGEITVYVGRLHSGVYFKVADTGVGIPKKDQSRIFERFYRVDKARSREMGGTGLGLAIAKEIVEAHHGTIEVSSEPGKGTEFIVKLPLDCM